MTNNKKKCNYIKEKTKHMKKLFFTLVMIILKALILDRNNLNKLIC